jgi:hypothetical protein
MEKNKKKKEEEERFVEYQTVLVDERSARVGYRRSVPQHPYLSTLSAKHLCSVAWGLPHNHAWVTHEHPLLNGLRLDL